MLTNLFSLALLASPIIAAPLSSSAIEKRNLFSFLDSTIKEVVEGVVDTTNTLDDAVTSWSGKIEDTGPILTGSQGLLDTINNGTATVKGADDLTLVGLLQLLPSVLSLNAAVETLTGDLIDKKPQVDAGGLTAVVLGQLQDQQKAAQGLVDTLLTKLPPLVPEALGEILSAPSLQALANAISVYSKT